MISFLEKKRIIKNQSDFALILGKQKSIISEMLSGDRKISEQFARLIEDAFPVIDGDWLLGKSDEMLKSERIIPHSAGESQNELLQVVKQQSEIASKLIAQNEEILKENKEIKQENKYLIRARKIRN